jgi:hypothetical protein
MHLHNSSATAANDPPETAGKLCLCLFGKTCLYIGGLAIICGAAIAALTALVQV